MKYSIAILSALAATTLALPVQKNFNPESQFSSSIDVELSPFLQSSGESSAAKQAINAYDLWSEGAPVGAPFPAPPRKRQAEVEANGYSGPQFDSTVSEPSGYSGLSPEPEDPISEQGEQPDQSGHSGQGNQGDLDLGGLSELTNGLLDDLSDISEAISGILRRRQLESLSLQNVTQGLGDLSGLLSGASGFGLSGGSETGALSDALLGGLSLIGDIF